jgi:hypothetical protein
MKTIICILLLCVLTAVTEAQEVLVVGGQVTEVGIYTSQVVTVTSTTNTVGGKLEGLDGFTLLRSTTNVPARIGTRFGFRYRIRGAPQNAPITLTLVGKHPLYTNPKTGKTSTRDQYQLLSWIGDTYTSYSFDETWELVPGIFTFEVWHQEKKLCEQSFTVVEDKKGKSSNQ